MHIGVDFDDTLFNAAKLKSEAALLKYGILLMPEMCGREVAVEQRKLITREQYEEIQSYAYSDQEFGMTMEPIPGSLECLARFEVDGHTLVVITSREREAASIAEQLLARHNLNIKVIGVGYDQTKRTAAETEGVKVFIDDDISNLTALHGVVPHLLLFHQARNAQDDPGKIGAHRMYGWSGIYDMISRISQASA